MDYEIALLHDLIELRCRNAHSEVASYRANEVGRAEAVDIERAIGRDVDAGHRGRCRDRLPLSRIIFTSRFGGTVVKLLGEVLLPVERPDLRCKVDLIRGGG